MNQEQVQRLMNEYATYRNRDAYRGIWTGIGYDSSDQLAQRENVARVASDIVMDTDLMALVKECETPGKLIEATKIGAALERAERLKRLGFVRAAAPVIEKAEMAKRLEKVTAENFIVIRPAKIQSFLDRLATEYNKKHGKSKDVCKTDFQGLPPLKARTVHASGYQGIGIFAWEETAIEDYAGIPPDNVLSRFEEVAAKKVFDYFTIGTVQAVKDPLLMGRVKGVEDRFFIAQWGDDVSLDDVI